MGRCIRRAGRWCISARAASCRSRPRSMDRCMRCTTATTATGCRIPPRWRRTLLAQMRDDNGSILIPGFTDGCAPSPPRNKTALQNLPPVERCLEAASSASAEPKAAKICPPASCGPRSTSAAFASGQVGDAAANAIPTDAVISMDFRLVPDQTPGRGARSRRTFLDRPRLDHRRRRSRRCDALRASRASSS